MSTGNDISTPCNEFTNALTEVLAENAAGPARRGRLARARAGLDLLTDPCGLAQSPPDWSSKACLQV
jgi:hypothetical protein